ncbi:AraC family transcriptional regulator [Litoribrevibacter albus]|uniref:AraC family transcriptional regulator n=1 Tax=Litoribrevibacter albus TaxID=1473156 RepID=A0AA37W6V0_9GAMM|nr:AraC family transcriptional regulator [Litoribrevibacter albus]GLQ30404.1 AraC family transcriptional regulator [Litoribrevibacter albus]
MLTTNANSQIQALANTVFAYSKREGDHNTGISGLTAHIRNAPTEPLHCIYTLSLAMVLQGGKQLSIHNEQLPCVAGQSMLTTFDLPVVSHVTEASRHHPFIALVLKLDYSLIMQVCAELNLSKPSRDMRYQPISIHEFDMELCDAMSRLFRLQQQEKFLPSLAPLIEKEIIIRLMDSPHGMHLRHLASAGSPSSQILKVVAWLKQNFTQSIGIETLAEQTHMSSSTFRQHFKALTGASPLQYLKTLRLQEARDQMLMNGLDASQASSFVGYESASQFSREYSRLFGLPPQKDIQRLRQF